MRDLEELQKENAEMKQQLLISESAQRERVTSDKKYARKFVEQAFMWLLAVGAGIVVTAIIQSVVISQ